MVIEEFLEMAEEDQYSWLKKQSESGRTVEEICEELGKPRSFLQGIGFTFALGEWHHLPLDVKTATNGQNMG